MSSFYSCSFPFNSEDLFLIQKVVNIGIDSHLEGFTESKFYKEDGYLVCSIEFNEMPILLRRLREVGTEDADSLAEDIEASWNGKEL